MTLKIQSYFKRYKSAKYRVDHSIDGVVHTDAPTCWRQIFKQRLRWDGDLFYIFFHRHWRMLRPCFMGWKAFIGVLWNGVLMGMIVPYIILIGSVIILIKYGLVVYTFLLILTYLYYLIIQTILFSVYILVISERKAYDCSFLWVLPLQPIYMTMMRMWCAIALTIQMVIRTHRDSTMAPDWINRQIH